MDLNEQQLEDVKYIQDHLLEFRDFPKPGINFRDFFSLTRNPVAYKKVIDLFSDHISKLNVDAVVGLESRGFVLGGAISYKLGIPFVPIRKKGKLPGKTIEFKYMLEYGSDIFEMQENAVKPGSRVVIVDDLIATGGSCEAAINLLQIIKAEVVEVVVLIDLAYLNWRSKVKTKTTAFLKFESE